MSISTLFGTRQEGFSKPAAQCDEDLSEVDATLDAMSVSSTRRSKAHIFHTVPPSIMQSDLEEVISEGSIMSMWEPSKWTCVKTLALAAAGKGIVELMTSQEQPAQSVAVKRMPWNLLRSSPEEFNREFPDAKERPWMDIAIVKHLNSVRFPYACNLLGLFLGPEHVYIMSSFANRGDLFAWCETDKSMPGVQREAVMRPILSQMFTGVCFLHNMGIAHRDLSCENVLLTDDGVGVLQVKIIDFGMASLSRTVIKEVRGKRSYQAPEMHGSTEFDTFLADNFSLGVISYCMAVHYYPWEQTKPGKDRSCELARMNGMEVFLQKKRLPCNKQPVGQVFSAFFCELLCGLLSFDPDMRYSIGEACFAKCQWKAANYGHDVSELCATSDVSTTDSVGSPSRDSAEVVPSDCEESDLDCHLDDKAAQAQPWKSRVSIWECYWLFLTV
mmetsp:Transcript_32384/g.56639  ORF Transcript_32384/g.56639 Transcript_32384/m.56639 type:complete len:443 (+) Transcript_32384:109-1437(+)